MNSRRILYDPDFIKEFKRLERTIQERAVKAERLFKNTPLHPSLRLHRLKGRLAGIWSISVTMNIRIIFKQINTGEIVFLSIGKHDIYRSL